MLQTLKDKRKSISTRLKMSFIVFVIALFIVIMVTLMYQNSSFGQFEIFSKDITVKGMAQKNVTAGGPNATINESGLRQNVSQEKVKSK